MPGSMSSRCRVVWACLVFRARADAESPVPGPMSSRLGPGPCQVVQAQTHVESYGLGPMSSRTGPGQCRVVWPANVEPFGSVSM